jgi:hypothetical protein
VFGVMIVLKNEEVIPTLIIYTIKRSDRQNAKTTNAIPDITAFTAGLGICKPTIR